MNLIVKKNSIQFEGNIEESKKMIDILSAYYGPKTKVIEIIRKES